MSMYIKLEDGRFLEVATVAEFVEDSGLKVSPQTMSLYLAKARDKDGVKAVKRQGVFDFYAVADLQDALEKYAPKPKPKPVSPEKYQEMVDLHTAAAAEAARLKALLDKYEETLIYLKGRGALDEMRWDDEGFPVMD